MPRPRTHKTGPRARQILIRVTEDDYARLSVKAKSARLTVSGLSERLVVEGKVEVRSAPDGSSLPVALINELKRIGNNLNQIAHAANSGLPPDHRMSARALHELLNTIVQDELLNRRSHVLRTRAYANDPPPPQTRAEFQRSVQVHPARRGPYDR